MKNRAEILNELRALNSPLAEFPATMPFAVPAHYFAAAPARLREGVTAAGSAVEPELQLSRNNPFAVPQGYFEELPVRLLRAASAEEADETLPVIGNAFAVPEGYFDNLAATLLQKAKAADVIVEEAAPAVPERRRSIRMPLLRPAIRWAAAAVVLLGVGFGSYRVLNTGSASADATRQLARLDKSELYRYVQQNIDDFEEDAIVLASADAAAPLNSVQLDLEEQEIIEYLDQNGWSAEELETEL